MLYSNGDSNRDIDIQNWKAIPTGQQLDGARIAPIWEIPHLKYAINYLDVINRWHHYEYDV